MSVIPRTFRKSKITPGILLCSGLIITLLFGCSRHTRFEGVLVRSYEDASSVVGTYPQDLTETQFLRDWPVIGKDTHKDELAWGIVDASTSKSRGKVKSSYWLGHFESKLITRTRVTGEGHTVTVADSSRTRIRVPAPKETFVEEQWTKYGVWRFDFEDSVLVSSKKIADF